jgi:hypothetical protein
MNDKKYWSIFDPSQNPNPKFKFKFLPFSMPLQIRIKRFITLKLTLQHGANCVSNLFIKDWRCCIIPKCNNLTLIWISDSRIILSYNNLFGIKNKMWKIKKAHICKFFINIMRYLALSPRRWLWWKFLNIFLLNFVHHEYHIATFY